MRHNFSKFNNTFNKYYKQNRKYIIIHRFLVSTVYTLLRERNIFKFKVKNFYKIYAYD